MTEPPWAGLGSGGPDARRVDSVARLEFFWFVSDRGAPGLLLLLPEGSEEVRPLPAVRSLSVRYGNVSSGRSLTIMLDDREQIELFEIFCRDVMKAAAQATTGQDALVRTVRRMMRWHHMLRGGASGRLGTDEQRGLVGELVLLTELADRLGEPAAVTAWQGPFGMPRDFELPGLCIESKARRAAAKPNIAISSENQLADVPGATLLLRVTDVDAGTGPSGSTLDALVAGILLRFSNCGSEHLFEQALVAAGFDAEDDYTDLYWTIGSARTFEVRDGFPRIVPPLPAGTGDLRYTISLEECRPFAVGEKSFEGMLNGTGETYE